MEKINDARFARLFSELKSEYAKSSQRIDTRLSQVENQISQSENNLSRWIMGVVLAIIVLGLAWI